VRDGVVMRCWGETCVPFTVTSTSREPTPRNVADAAEDARRMSPPVAIDPDSGDALPPRANER
jgi:hypothetical protein